jgi:hypothetical protein
MLSYQKQAVVSCGDRRRPRAGSGLEDLLVRMWMDTGNDAATSSSGMVLYGQMAFESYISINRERSV